MSDFDFNDLESLDDSIDKAQRTETLARHYLEIRSWDKALEVLAEAPVELLDTAWYWFAQGLARFQLDDHDGAIGAYERGLEIEPENVQLMSALASCHEHENRYVEAEELLLEALRIEPEDADLLARYASLSAVAGQTDKAERLLDRALELDPDRREEPRTRWLIDHLKGDSAGRQKASDELMAENPDEASTLLLKAADLVEAKQTMRAWSLLREAATLDPRVVEENRELYEEARLQAHPAMLPVRWAAQIGPFKIWLAFIALITVGRNFLPPPVVRWTALIYVLFCVYTWVATPLLRRLTQGRWRSRSADSS